MQALDAHLSALAEELRLPGIAVSLWGPNGPIFEKGYGHADADGLRPVDADTLFGIASMSKSMATLACALLENEGKVSFSDPVIRYIPAFSLPGTPKQSVTLRHLAMHTTGIPPIEVLTWSIAEHMKERLEPWAAKAREAATTRVDTLSDILTYLADCPHPLLGEPGQCMSYCNEGYAILSTIVDIVAGQSIESFLQERVFTPLGMTRTVLDTDGGDAKQLAGGNITSLFEREKEQLTCDDEWSVAPPYRACGWVKSTARDMAVYYRALSQYGRHEGRQVLPYAAIEAMVGIGFPAPIEPAYCLGLTKRTFHGRTVCEHSGALHGTSSSGAFLLGEGYGMAALSNIGGAQVEGFVTAMLNTLMELPLLENHRWFAPIEEPFQDIDMILGTYRTHEGSPPIDITLYLDDGVLFAVKEEDDEVLREPVRYCGGTLFAIFDREDKLLMRMQAYIRNGKAWAMRCGTRFWQRV